MVRVNVGFRSSQGGTREVPEDEFAVFADTDEAHRAVFGTFGVERDACDPTRVPWAVSNDVLFVRGVDCQEIVLSSGLVSESPRVSQGEVRGRLREKPTTTKRPSGLQETQLREPKYDAKESRSLIKKGEGESVFLGPGEQGKRRIETHFSSTRSIIRRHPSSPTVAQNC